MSDVDEMVAWFRACLDGDERDAHDVHNHMCSKFLDPGGDCSCGQPARQLRKVKAMREILDRYEEQCERVRNPVSADARAAARVGQFELEGVVRLLAATVDDRPGYREEWRP